MTCCEIVISVLSIITSGVISWLISSFYYKKTSRDDALNQLIVRVYVLTCTHPNKDGVEQFKQIVMSHELKFLKREESKIINELFRLYKEVGFYSDIELFALVLRDHYKRIIKNQGINTEIETGFDDVNKVEVHIEPIEYSNCAKRIKSYLLDNNLYPFFVDDSNYEWYQNEINELFNQMCNSTFGADTDIDFFEHSSILEIIKKSELMIRHHEAFEKYSKKEKEFCEKFKKDIDLEWGEFFLENEGYPF